ncbi:MAG: NUDIX hydrolase [Segniliparus sp.]|uniref:NUDIX hydrolase n=1 Tax=Segniliparus sp. TaxID=2804064 RepID=UPI003F312137
MTLLLVVALVVLLLGMLLFAGWMVKTARRLDRLHVRRDLAWQGLLAALDRRALVARTVAAQLGPSGADLARIARAVETAAVPNGAASAEAASGDARPGREQLESELSVALAGVGQGGFSDQLLEERADAECRVRFARSFYNEAVRDTLALRTRPAVRLFKLAGSAPLPVYFEIAEGLGPRAE